MILVLYWSLYGLFVSVWIVRWQGSAWNPNTYIKKTLCASKSVQCAMTKEQLLATKEGFRFTKEWEEYWQMNLHFFEKLSGREGDRKAPLFDAATVCICTLTKLYLLICISTQLYLCIWTWAGTLHKTYVAQSSNHKSNLAHMTLYQALKRTFQFLNLKIRPEKRMALIYWQ